MSVYKNPDFCRLPAAAAELFSQAGKTSFFSLPGWYDVMARFGVPQGTETRVYADERPGSAAALALQSAPNRGRHLESLANFYSIEHGVIAAPTADIEAGLGAIIAEIVAARPRWECLRMVELDPRDPGYGALCRVLRRAGFLIECSFSSASWYADTTALGFADYLATRPAQLRNTWLRKRRSLDRGRRLRVAFFPGDIGIDQAIADYQSVYAASWKQAEPFAQFMPALMHLAAELRALRLGIYYIDSAPAAAQFWIIWNGRAAIYKLAHDQRFDTLSLGTLLTMAMIERALETDHPREINFGRGDDPYKRLWLPHRRERWGIAAFNPRTLGGLRLGLEREMAKLYHRVRGERVMPDAA
jgi:Acetyltransferase (GNAT) domain